MKVIMIIKIIVIKIIMIKTASSFFTQKNYSTPSTFKKGVPTKLNFIMFRKNQYKTKFDTKTVQ